MGIRRLVFACLIACLVLPGLAGARVRHVKNVKLAPTHGDPHRGKKVKFRRAARTSTLSPTWGCDPSPSDRAPLSSAPQVKVIYAYPTDIGDNLSTYANLFQADAQALDDKVAAESGNTKTIRFDVGGSGGACTADSSNRLDIETVPLDHDSSYYANLSDTFEGLRSELARKLTPADPHQRVNYLVYLDNVGPGGNIAGQADLLFDETHAYTNRLNQGEDGNGHLFAMVYGGGTSDFVGGYGADDRRSTALHELSHTLGAVQMSAPHSSGGGHCYDGEDIMCYDDGGSYFNGGGAMTYPCAASSTFAGTTNSIRLDCGQDDYFNASPGAGSYLDTHWNEYDSVFLCPVDNCEPSGSFAVSLSAGRPDGHFALTADTGGVPIQHYEWNVTGDSSYETETGSDAVLHPQFGAAGTRTIEVRAVKADGTFAYASLPMSIRLPNVTIRFPSAPVVGNPITLDASGTTDPSGLIDSFVWDTDGDGILDTDTGLVPKATAHFARAGQQQVLLEVRGAFAPIDLAVPVNVLGSGTGAGGTTLNGTLGGQTVVIANPTVSANAVRISKLIRNGLRLNVTCGAVCQVSLKLVIDKKTARKLRLKPHGDSLAIGRIAGQFAPGSAAHPVLRLTLAAQRALAHAKSLKATLTGTVAQVGLKNLNISKPLSFQR